MSLTGIRTLALKISLDEANYENNLNWEHKMIVGFS